MVTVEKKKVGGRRIEVEIAQINRRIKIVKKIKRKY
jgi:hypothetical protein